MLFRAVASFCEELHATVRGPLPRALLLAACSLLLVACQMPAQSAPAREIPTLRLGLLPVVDALPLHVAARNGYFEEAGVRVELLEFSSAVERDSAIQARQLDAQLNDLVATLLLNQGGQQLTVVRKAYQGNPRMPMMYILAGPGGRLSDATALTGKSLALSSNSVIEYTSERILQGQGVATNLVQYTEVTRIPVRYEMLMQKQVAAATLPDPFASLALVEGAALLADDGATRAGQSIISVRSDYLAANPQAVNAFLQAYERAVQAIAAEPARYKPLLVEQARLPARIVDSFQVPTYPKASVPTVAEVEDVVAWMLAKQLLSVAPAYADLVHPGLLPQ